MPTALRNYGIVAGIALCILTAVASYSCIEPRSELQAFDGARGLSRVANAIYQQDVDHFSDDARAMSPRSWGDFQSGDSEPQAPAVSFGTPPPRPEEPGLNPDSNRFLQAEHGRVRNPKEYYETNPLNSKNASGGKNTRSSPLPNDLFTPRQSGDPQTNKGPTNAVDDPANQEPLQSRLENNAPVESQLRGPQPAPQNNAFETTQYGSALNPGSGYGGVCQCHTRPRANNCPDCGLPQSNEQIGDHRRPGRCRSCGRSRCGRSSPSTGCPDCELHSGGSCGCDACSDYGGVAPKYNPALGHRQPYPITEQSYGSSAETFPFEEGKEYPSPREILMKSLFFAEADLMFLQPSFQANTAVTISGPGFGVSQPFNFDLLPSFRVSGGLQTEFGPGVSIDYFQFDNNSRVNTFISNGVASGTTQIYQLGPNLWTSLTADDPGETINSQHSMELHSTSIHAFKAINFKRSSVNGRFGLQYVTLEQKLESELFGPGGVSMGQLTGTSDLKAFGPRFGVDYVRKIGHTPLQIVSSGTTSVLFGDRDQFVVNTLTGDISRIGADEFLTIIDIFLGVQSKQYRGEKRNISMRVGFVNQTWLGGGTAIDPSGDFGFQGFSVMFGVNR